MWFGWCGGCGMVRTPHYNMLLICPMSLFHNICYFLNISDNRTCSICNQSETFASIFDNFCNAHFGESIIFQRTNNIINHQNLPMSEKLLANVNLK